MALTDWLLDRAFGNPRGILGNVGGRVMARTNDDAARWVVSLLDLAPTDRVLEVGFGPGVGIELASAAASEGFVAGVDPAKGMVEQARRRNATAIEAGRVELRRGVADDLPYADGTFDAAFSVNSMQVWPDAVAGLRELHRVLKPGGSVALAFTPHAGGSRDELPGPLARAGFERVRIREQDEAFCATATATK
ncbi:class I SAM-dependent methyltransferase [Halegenticoccus tardaugens]|uniref:class I SAM-dependent methyltransferase n=1 Tax=Halegenticoccus tardaugens TaxID=2071624 RepID=UPI001E30AB8F|nr:methyltransferase domain-containing protein [Halegenticoccus tardaugens]